MLIMCFFYIFCWYSNTFCSYEPEDHLEWSLVLEEIKGFIKAEAAVAVLHADSNPIILSHRWVVGTIVQPSSVHFARAFVGGVEVWRACGDFSYVGLLLFLSYMLYVCVGIRVLLLFCCYHLFRLFVCAYHRRLEKKKKHKRNTHRCHSSRTFPCFPLHLHTQTHTRQWISSGE